MKKIASLPVLSEEQRDDAALRAQDLAWSSLAGLFDDYAHSQKLTYEKLGARIRRSKSHVQRWLSSPFNMSLRSLGLLAEALDAELVIRLEPRGQRAARKSYKHPAEQMSLTPPPSTSQEQRPLDTGKPTGSEAGAESLWLGVS
jgi:transcriptional regulator with XRE-family HTH domain